MNTECDEVADTMRTNAPKFARFDDAIHYVRKLMPDESVQIIDNVAWSLYAQQAAA